MSRGPIWLHSNALTIITLCCAATIFANDLNSGGHRGIVRTLSTETFGKTGATFGGALKYSTEMEYVAGPNRTTSVINLSTNRAVDRIAPHLISGNVFGVYGLTSFWDVGVDLPLYYDLPGWDDLHRSGIGDLELTTKLAYPFGRTEAWWSQAYALKVLLPTGDADRGYFSRHVYYLTSDKMIDTNSVFAVSSVYFNPMMIWSLDLSATKKRIPLKLHANFGGVIATAKSNSALVAAFGAEISPNHLFTIFTEISGESRVKWYTDVFKITDFINDPFRVTPGMKFNFPNGLRLTLAGDIGVSKKSARFRTSFARKGYAYTTKAVPLYGALLTLAWEGKGSAADNDGDSIEDKSDSCRYEAEDYDGFNDADGCPDIDNDNDGMIDSRDSCPLEPARHSGCPVYDKDGDMINDDVDKCVNGAEDYDSFEDNDGCPEGDNDNDGIVDSNDKCPNRAEDMDGFEDADGCIDFDNDGDGIPDSLDKCPAIKGVAENNGCPKSEEIRRGRLILDGVNFESGKAILTPNSYTVLDRVYESLSEWLNVMLEIRGHTDNLGNDKFNLDLSQQRAETVMQYLVSKGIDSSRLRAIGFGESSPLADNRNAAGRAQNRRVELKRTD